MRLRENTGAALREAGFAVISAGSAEGVAVPMALSDVRIVALVEHVLGDRTSSWSRVRRQLPRGALIIGLVEAVGPGDTVQAVLVTRGEQAVLGPMPLSELPTAIGWVSPAGSKRTIAGGRSDRAERSGAGEISGFRRRSPVSTGG